MRLESSTPSLRRWGSGPWASGGKSWLWLILVVACTALAMLPIIAAAYTLGFGARARETGEIIAGGPRSWWKAKQAYAELPCFAYIVTGLNLEERWDGDQS